MADEGVLSACAFTSSASRECFAASWYLVWNQVRYWGLVQLPILCLSIIYEWLELSNVSRLERLRELFDAPIIQVSNHVFQVITCIYVCMAWIVRGGSLSVNFSSWSVESVFLIITGVGYGVRWIAAKHKVRYTIRLHSLFDLLSMISHFTLSFQTYPVDGRLRRSWLDFGFLRSYILYVVIGHLFTQYKHKTFFTQVMLVIFKVWCLVFFAACVLFSLEQLGDLPYTDTFLLHVYKCFNEDGQHILVYNSSGTEEFSSCKETWSFFTAIYFMFVTVSTVGYGDFSPKTVLGQLMVCVIIVVGIYTFANESAALLSIYGDMRHGRVKYDLSRNAAHVIVTGNPSAAQMKDFIREFFHPDHEALLRDNDDFDEHEHSEVDDDDHCDDENECRSSIANSNLKHDELEQANRVRETHIVILMPFYDDSNSGNGGSDSVVGGGSGLSFHDEIMEFVQENPRYQKRVFLVYGSPLRAKDLRNARLDQAMAVFFLPNKFSNDGSREDAATVLRVMSPVENETAWSVIMSSSTMGFAWRRLGALRRVPLRQERPPQSLHIHRHSLLPLAQLAQVAGFTTHAPAPDATRLLRAVETFRARHGHALVPPRFVVPQDAAWPSELHGLRVGKWLRSAVRDSQLQPTLQVIDAVFASARGSDYAEFHWRHTTLAALQAFTEIHGHPYVPRTFVVPLEAAGERWPLATRALPLGHQVHALRKAYRAGSLARARVDALDALDFAWDVMEHKWSTRFLPALRRFHALHGHCDVPQSFVVPSEGEAVAQWGDLPACHGYRLGAAVNHVRLGDSFALQVATHQRELEALGFARSSSDHQWSARRELEALGFARSSSDHQWSARVLPALEAYSRLHGHCHVPVAFSVPLDDARWPEGTRGMRLGFIVQNIQYRGDFLPQVLRDAERLEALGFVWNRAEFKWRCVVFPALEAFALGFVWNRAEFKWRCVVFPALEAFVRLHGHSDVPVGFVVPAEAPWPPATHGLRLGRIAALRSARAKFADYVEIDEKRLQALGFDWSVVESELKDDDGDVETWDNR
ncbi:hypothetical protein ATCC90586_002730 [Pythium insidiosum]|nr:hypothetical protein ATCC90586_002730 [Pythium insidiosum]